MSNDVSWWIADYINDIGNIPVVPSVAVSCIKIVRIENEYRFFSTSLNPFSFLTYLMHHLVRIAWMSTPLKWTHASELMLPEILWQTFIGRGEI